MTLFFSSRINSLYRKAKNWRNSFVLQKILYDALIRFNALKSKDLNKKIIIGPSFPIGTANNTFELLFSSYALCKGWNIIPVVCDSIQQTEVMLFLEFGSKSFQSHCKECNAHSQKIWNKL